MLTGQRMIRTHQYEEGLFCQFLINELIAQRSPLVINDHIQGAAVDRMEQFFMGTGGQGQADIRMSRCKNLYCFLDNTDAKAVQYAYTQALVFSRTDPPDFPDQAVQGRHLALSLLIEILTCRRYGEFPAMPLQQLNLQFLFQRLNLLGNR